MFVPFLFPLLLFVLLFVFFFLFGFFSFFGGGGLLCGRVDGLFLLGLVPSTVDFNGLDCGFRADVEIHDRKS